MFDYILFISLNDINFSDNHMYNEIIKVFLVISISILLTLTLYSWVIKNVTKLINWVRLRNNESPLDPQSVRKIIFNKREPYLVYIYNLETNKLISCGYMDKYNTPSEEDFEMSVFPISSKKATYDRIYEIAVSESYKKNRPMLYLNFEKKIKIIVFYNE